MDALAGVLEARGSIGEAAGWRLAATTSWQARVAVLPEAYSTHYAEHVLGNGDPKQALALAQREYDRRPFSTPIVNYARALNHNGQPQKALAVLRTGFRAGFYTPGMLSEESSAFAALGRPIEAWVAMASAQALNPKISDPRRIFVVFDQD